MRFFPTVAHDYSPPRRAGQAIHGGGPCNQCFKDFDFLTGQMIVPFSIYWNMGIGRAKGTVEQDEEGLKTMQTLGQNMA